LLLVGVWAITVLAARALGDGSTGEIVFSLMCGALYLALLPLDTRRPLSISLVPPLILVLLCTGWVYLCWISGDIHPLLPTYEQRLTNDLVCRKYPKWNDSLLASRVVLVREGGWFTDHVIDTVNGDSASNCISCTVLSEDLVRLSIADCDGLLGNAKRVLVQAD
jgi:hypothetical protein